MNHSSLLRFVIAALFVFSQLLTAAPVQAEPSSQPAAQSFMNVRDVQMVDGIIYFLYKNPIEIKRYDTASQTWLSPIPLPTTPTAFLVNDSEILVALGNTIVRYNLDGTGQTNFWTGQIPVVKILADEQIVFACQKESSNYDESHSLLSIPRATREVADSITDYFTCDSLSIAPGLKKLFARTRSIAPSDILYAAYDDLGMMPAYWNESPYHGDFPTANKTWVFPDASKVIEDTGIVYSTDGLNFARSLLYDTQTNGSLIADLAFAESATVTLRNGIITAYNQSLIDFAAYTPSYLPSRIFAAGDTIYVIRDTTPLPLIEAVPLSSFQTYSPADPIDAYGLPYTIDGLAYDPAGIVYLMNKESRNIFRWSVASRAYIDPIPLLRKPQYIAFAPELGRLYVAYETNEIMQIRPAESLTPAPFSLASYPLCGLVAAGNTLLVCNRAGGSSYGDFFYTAFSSDGTETSNWNTIYSGYSGTNSAFAWSGSRRTMYAAHHYEWSFYWFEITPEGEITNWAGYNQSVDGTKSPLRISGDETELFIGPDYVFNLSPEVSQAARLPHTVKDAAWFEGKLFTLRENTSASQIELWDTSYSSSTSRSLIGSPLHLISTTEGLLAITQYLSIPRFTLLDAALNPIYDSPAANFHADPISGFSPLTVKFTNLSENDEGASYLWDFGDGETSTEANPEHTYIDQKRYTVTLTVTGVSGSDRVTKEDYISVLQPTYLPLTLISYPQNTYENACQSFRMFATGYGFVGTMTECVTAIVDRGTWRVIFTWTPDLDTSYLCIDKLSDWGNPNMYIKDQYGNRYTMVNAGGAASAIYCLTDDQTYTGWFDFPKQAVQSPIFTFYDDDNEIQIGPLVAP